MKIKTRFAPSPTGGLHIGSARTALYSWLFARHLGGDFILRIEDSDIERSTTHAAEAIIASMKWLNIYWDEGPYFQTNRLNRYNTVISDMLSHGTAYKCYCSKDQLKMLRKNQIARGEKPRYDGRCRNQHDIHSPSDSCVVRFKNPRNGSVIFNDLIRGTIKVNNQELDDLVIRRADGSPTYNFCVVVDDYDMAITHVIRGEDHINNTPRQINIFKALKAPIPNYAHVSMILGNDGKKLSKRHGSTEVMQYCEDGFLPEALINYLVRLGWSHGNQEIFSIEEMQKLFNLKNLSKSASIFNIKKLLWLNQYYINHLPTDYVANYLFSHMKNQGIDVSSGPPLTDIIKLLGKRHKTLRDIATNCRYFYEDFIELDIDLAKKYLLPTTSQKVLQLIHIKLAELREWTPNLILAVIKKTANEVQAKVSEVSMLLRFAVTGVTCSPPIDATLYTMGQVKTLERIDLALNFIENLDQYA